VKMEVPKRGKKAVFGKYGKHFVGLFGKEEV
jgi:hypothetical protein